MEHVIVYFIVIGAAGIIAVLTIAITIWLSDRAGELTPEEREIVELFGQMRAEDTGGLLALPRYDTTVQIAAVDRRAAVRTLTVNHEDVPGRDGKRPATRDTGHPAGGFIPAPPDMGPDAGSSSPVTAATCAGSPMPKVDSPAPAVAAGREGSSSGPAGGLQPGPASLETGPESEPSGVTVPAPPLDDGESPWEHTLSWYMEPAIFADADARAAVA